MISARGGGGGGRARLVPSTARAPKKSRLGFPGGVSWCRAGRLLLAWRWWVMCHIIIIIIVIVRL